MQLIIIFFMYIRFIMILSDVIQLVHESNGYVYVEYRSFLFALFS